MKPGGGSANAQPGSVPQALGNRSTSPRALEPFPEYIGLKRTPDIEPPAHGERRRRARADLHWTLHLVRHPGRAPFESVTDNLSSEGLRCLCEEQLVPGEYLECVLFVPTQTRESSQEFLTLRCMVQVIWVAPTACGGFGVGLHIEDYMVIPPDLVRAN